MNQKSEWRWQIEGSAVGNSFAPESDRLEVHDWAKWLANWNDSWIDNVDTIPGVLQNDGTLLPTTLNDGQYSNSYICSPYTGAVTYPIEELKHLSSFPLRCSLRMILGCLSPILKWAKINHVIGVNNQLFSTCLYPENLKGIESLTSKLVEEFSEHAILFRSLNSVTNETLMETLQRCGYMLIPSRQVYLFEPGTGFWNKTNTKRDQKKLRDSPYQLVEHDQLGDDDDERICQLYGQLYLEKYSLHNPQYGVPLIRHWRREKILQMKGLRHPDGTLDGIVGIFRVGNVISAPLVGYQLSRSSADGIYRMLMGLVLREAHETGRLLNLSSGAADFKRVRGGRPNIEYSAVYVKHLTWGRKLTWRTLGLLLEKIGARILKKYQL